MKHLTVIHGSRLVLFTLSCTGVFWQITDIHYDFNYSRFGNPGKLCHQSKTTNSTRSVGLFGNYKCDSPWTLVTTAIDGMKAINAKPDFILWTGDSMSHVSDNQSSLLKVYLTIRNVSNLIHSAFPNVSVFPVLGNHDPYPSNNMPIGSNYYEKIISMSGWKQFLGKSEQEQFMKGGFYVSTVVTGIRVIGLNTNLLYSKNPLVQGHKDPSNQFAWLIKQLEDAKSKGLKVYIISHIPPGAFERTSLKIKWFYPEYNQPYLDILRRYSDVILAQFYGHGHTDSFRILYNKTGYPINALYLSPAVTPWKSSLPGTGSNNPALRLYYYNRNTGQVLDYVQYFLNLTKANLEKKPVWEVEYHATKAYSIPDISAQSLNKVTKTFHRSSPTFELYFKYNSVSHGVQETCDTNCYYIQYCAIVNLDFNDFDRCIFWRGTMPHPAHHRSTIHHHHHKTKSPPDYAFYVIGGLALVVLILALIVGCLCLGRHNQNAGYKYGKFVGPVN
ncbi:acid sphingomyelinase-like phosphodiesterase 3b isoform X2 [Gigantopelta aegis]|uniref:acid sphingomyelinase-like phosphodiesterase 3b isoform X2 n=1 Tax=Gigantopelta aegis TaxID=1735272 RepID=UPI001B88B172|nr:acid sphingomyelinase-like phosphodiesterase 3b isoform X2 [Gigantopelta aegis]